MKILANLKQLEIESQESSIPIEENVSEEVHYRHNDHCEDVYLSKHPEVAGLMNIEPTAVVALSGSHNRNQIKKTSLNQQ